MLPAARVPPAKGFGVQQRFFCGSFSHKRCLSKSETLTSRNDTFRPALNPVLVWAAAEPPAHTWGPREPQTQPGLLGKQLHTELCLYRTTNTPTKAGQHLVLNYLSISNGGEEWLSQVLPLLWRPWCREGGAQHLSPDFFIYLQTYPRAGQSPVEPWLYPPFPPALISNAIPQRVKLPETSPHSQWFMFNLYKWRKWDFKFQCHFCNEVIKRERGIAFYCIEYWSQCYFP